MNSKNIPTLKSSKVKIGITMGDPSGIGPAITLKAIRKLRGLADFVVIGDEWVLNRISHIAPCLPEQVRYRISGAHLVDLKNVSHKNFSFGKIRAEYGRASIEYLDKALELIKNRQIDCLVTCPISKEAVNLAGLTGFSGHTEYLAKHSGTKNFVMMLLNRHLKISLVTRHIPLKSVSRSLDKDKLYKNIYITHQALKKLFAIKNPRIVVCGLNPHASDNGLMGNEENQIIKPVLKKLKRLIKYIDGPLPADVAIKRAREKRYDCVIAMYHDQALIPLKLLGDRTGVNITLGLSFIRTSPLHGTAFDIAAKFSLVDPASLIEAIKLAVRCTQNLKRD